MTPRDVQHTPDELSLKSATDDLIVAVGGPKRAEGYARPDLRRFSDYVLPNVGSFIPADAILALERRAVGSAHWPQVTRELARQTGHVLVKLPTADGDATGEVTACAVAHAKESNDVTTRLLGAGQLTRARVRDLELVREARENVEASVKLLAMLEAIDGGDE